MGLELKSEKHQAQSAAQDKNLVDFIYENGSVFIVIPIQIEVCDCYSHQATHQKNNYRQAEKWVNKKGWNKTQEVYK